MSRQRNYFEILSEWAERNHVRFVSRSDGQRTTDTVSRAALLELLASAPEAQRVPDGVVMVDRGALNMVINMLRRDEANGMRIRGEAADLLSAAPAQTTLDRIRAAGPAAMEQACNEQASVIEAAKGKP